MQKNITLSTKIIAKLVLHLVLLMSCGTAGIVGLNEVFEEEEIITQNMVPALDYLRESGIDVYQATLAKTLLSNATKNSKEFYEAKQLYFKNMAQVEARLDKFYASDNSPIINSLIPSFKTSYDQWKKHSEQRVNGLLNSPTQKTEVKDYNDLILFNIMEDKLDHIAETLREDIETQSVYSNKYFKNTTIILYAIIITSIIIGSLLSYLFYKNIFNILGGEPRKMAQLTDNIAHGNLSQITDSQPEKAVGLYKSLIILSNNLMETVTKLSPKENIKDNKECIANVFKQIMEVEKQSSLNFLVTGVAHELNTPVGTAITYVTYQQDQLASLVQDYQNKNFKQSKFEKFCANLEESLKDTDICLNRAADLIGTFKQLAVSQSPEATKTVNLHKYIEQSLAIITGQIEEKGHKLLLTGDMAIQINTQPETIMVVIKSLIENSLLHGLKDIDNEPITNGIIEIEISDYNEEFVLISCTDNGKGIAPKDIKSIFDPFYTTSRNTGHIGLGLHIIHTIVSQTLRGSIKCKSAINEGTSFEIKINKDLSLH